MYVLAVIEHPTPEQTAAATEIVNQWLHESSWYGTSSDRGRPFGAYINGRKVMWYHPQWGNQMNIPLWTEEIRSGHLESNTFKWITCANNMALISIEEDGAIVVEIDSRRHGIPFASTRLGREPWWRLLPEGLPNVQILRYESYEQDWHPLDTTQIREARLAKTA